MIRVCLVGASGRMGNLLRTAISRAEDMTLSGAVVAHTAADRGAVWDGIEVTADVGRGMESADLVFDFSVPAISLEVARAASERRIPLVLGTTGHSVEQRSELDSFVPRAPLLLAPNTSLGIYALTEIARVARSILGPAFDVEVFELHHRLKVDAPSGTAKLLAQAIGAGTEDRSNGGARSPNSVGVASLRGGDVPGEHTVFFVGSAERLELTHRVRDRAVFADGAIRLGRGLMGLPPGRYGVGDILRGA